MAVMQNFVWF